MQTAIFNLKLKYPKVFEDKKIDVGQCGHVHNAVRKLYIARRADKSYVIHSRGSCTAETIHLYNIYDTFRSWNEIFAGVLKNLYVPHDDQEVGIEEFLAVARECNEHSK